MRWVLSFFRLLRKPPTLAELPLLLLKCSIWGALTGPIYALFFTSVFNPAEVAGFVASPGAIVGSMMVGVIFGLSFYVCCGIGSAWLHRFVDRLPYGAMRGLMVAYNAFASSLAFSIAASLSRLVTFGNIRIAMPHFRQVLIVEAVFGAVLAVVIGAFIKLKAQVERAQAELHERELVQRSLAEQTARAQSLALQSQINPHFFFNTLNTISALIDDDPVAAQRMIGRMADMFRYTLSCTHTDAVALHQEIDFVRDYLAIEQARFRKRLTVELPEAPLPNVRVPGLVLQPLVENAVKHGIATLLGGGTVSIRIEQTGGTARVSVRNTSDEGVSLDPAALFRPGHALENVRARLRLFTGQAEPLRFCSAGRFTEFSFEMKAEPR